MRRIVNMLAGVLFVGWAVAGISTPATRAQTTAPSIAPSELLLSWHANTYVPSEFLGKPLPVARSYVTVSVQAIRNGRLASLSGEATRWYVNGNLVASEVGRQSLTIAVPANPPGSIDVRLELPEATIEPAVKTITIPVVEPVAVIVAPFPSATIPPNTTAVMHAEPFYFNTTSVRNLLFSWAVNDEAADATENPDLLELSVGSGSGRASISAIVRNPLVAEEVAQGLLDLRIAP